MYELGSVAQPGAEIDETPNHLMCSAQKHGPSLMLTGDYMSFFRHHKIVAGTTSLKIPTKHISAKMEVNLNNPVATELIIFSTTATTNEGLAQTPRRSLIEDYHGFFKTLVVRVSDTWGNSPTFNAKEISNHVFSDDLTMVRLYLEYSIMTFVTSSVT